MKTLWQRLVAGTALLLLAGPVTGQVEFLQFKDVQKDLKLSQNHIMKAGELYAKLKEDLQNRPKMEDFKKPEQWLEKLKQLSVKWREAEKKGMADILNADQAQRLKQLELQQRCPRDFHSNLTGTFGGRGSGKIAQDLKLDSSSINDLADQAACKIIAWRRDTKTWPPPEEFQKKVAELYKKTMAGIVKNLNKEQQARWREMAGEPFQGLLPGGGTYPGIGSPLPLSLVPKDPPRQQ